MKAKERAPKAARIKKQITYKAALVRLTVDFSVEIFAGQIRTG
jgi:hypothetical protein